jgi:hypothetical protein
MGLLLIEAETAAGVAARERPFILWKSIVFFERREWLVYITWRDGVK